MTGRRVTLGRVAGVYGVRGWLHIDAQTRPATRILKYPRWWLRQGDQETEVRLIEGRAHGNGVVAHLGNAQGQAIDDRDAAARLVGAQIQVGREDLPKLPKGQYYWVDLIGLDVVGRSGARLGRVRDVTSNGVQDVLVVDDAGSERLIPFVRGPIIKRVELAAGRILCEWDADY
ncbi:ribosome maturation factor RimM [Fontimonas sp. SYSU GA230001]|uniref:ribosome maturation factor RimM n=1 Tax=Fontimonas sp. SYSU GA230001 TaxID=3142450 RepID=UPI0032B43EAE